MGAMPCGERPLASTTWAPASRARWTAACTAGEISSCVIPAPSTHFRIVPSMSRATSFGRHASVTDGLQDLTAAHPRLQGLRDPDRAVGLLVRLEDRDDRAG